MSLFQGASWSWEFYKGFAANWLQCRESLQLCIVSSPSSFLWQAAQEQGGCTSLQCHTSSLWYLHRLFSAYPLSTLVIINWCVIPSYETTLRFRHKNQLWEVPYVCRKSKHQKMLYINTYHSLWFLVFMGINWLYEIWELYSFTARTKSQLVPSAFTTKKAPWIRPFRRKKTLFWTFCRSWILSHRIVSILPVHLQCKRFLFKVRVLTH